MDSELVVHDGGCHCKNFLTTYSFGTHTAKHTFCKVCGITSFYYPRSNPDGVAITYRCVDPGTLSSVEVKYYDEKLGKLIQPVEHSVGRLVTKGMKNGTCLNFFISTNSVGSKEE
ncbi:hypothetical protein M0R45_000569 [Rubus argutus]|uniref:CENP-V/GFA domain-containing protein n=1 Tax=Rubus argutus TaxID=59490 RepID=A0AAW1VMZ0_RUBAR